MKPTNQFIYLLLFLISSTTFGQQLEAPIVLWPNGAPGATGTSDEDKPAIIPFIPDSNKRNGAAVLVVPGGGFTIRAVDHEGVLVAQWLKEHGITAFLLRYRLRPIYTREHWVHDGKRAMQYIRAHADDYHISTNRVGTVAFSAGADLIADMSLNPLESQPNSTDLLDHMPSKPNFMILGYGSSRLPDSLDNTTIAKLPPTFMYGTVEDRGSQNGMLNMYTRLYQAGASVEAHFFRYGIHGTGFAVGDPVLGEWKHLLYNWMWAGGFLTEKPQIELNGVVKLNGEPLKKGMIILMPIENKNNPPVVVYINNTGTGELGRFSVPKDQGPVQGKYKVEVRQDATRWTSNSRDPFMINMMQKQRKHELTETDIKAWSDYIRKRDLSPSIYNQVVYSHTYPNDTEDYVLTIEEGKEILVEVFSE
ncbi:alpha/beta hydrolase [Confluentibacter sediminis]|uniref:alpha/beta hydrolase n=1 Tax=Confluentibacter sediminis TaxID=2219045 RepID=UPI000DABF087|nr:alpha/beta hydrolase [Confluentibacter sediminis]